MIKYKFNTEQIFNNAIQEAKDKNIKITYKNIKPFTFPCDIPVDKIWNDGKIIELQIYNREDFVKQPYDINDLLYSTIDFVSEDDSKHISTFDFGRAFVKGIQYKEDKNGNLINKIEYLKVCHVNDKRTGNEYTDEVQKVIRDTWKEKVYLDEIYKVYPKEKRENNGTNEVIF